ncbi:MAG: hypothetical protein ACK5D5_02905 [Bacteroidota bacterium]
MFSQDNKNKNLSGKKPYSEKVFHSLGTSVYLDIFNGPVREVRNTITDPFGNTSTLFDYTRMSGYSYLTIIYHYRYNLYELGSDVSFSVSGKPSLGLFAGQSLPVSNYGAIPIGFSACMNLPVMAGFNFGAGATNTSSSSMGLYIGGGYEYNIAPMFYIRKPDNKDIQTRWLSPCISLGYRYEGNSSFGNLQEVNLKIGFGMVGKDIKSPNNLGNQPFVFTVPNTIRLSYFTYLNY